jgi:two-component system, OmpR family, sensor kinase
VNAMLDRLEAAFDTQQQFLDDAGHELRTPLTIVRGHLELLDAADPADVEAVRALVMDELDRMARLVTDLILLAQSRRPDFVRFAPVDLDRLLRSVLGKACALADRQWLVESTIAATALADEQRLTQAMLQLADNAARHTEPGDVVALGGAVVGPRVLLWVRDTGAGIAPQDAERIFERFGRAVPARRDEGSGLGLSIVAGIATAHRGRVALGQPSSPGACFTLELPLTLVVPGAAADPEAQGASLPTPAWAIADPDRRP